MSVIFHRRLVPSDVFSGRACAPPSWLSQPFYPFSRPESHVSFFKKTFPSKVVPGCATVFSICDIPIHIYIVIYKHIDVHKLILQKREICNCSNLAGNCDFPWILHRCLACFVRDVCPVLAMRRYFHERALSWKWQGFSRAPVSGREVSMCIIFIVPRYCCGAFLLPSETVPIGPAAEPQTCLLLPRMWSEENERKLVPRIRSEDKQRAERS